MLKIRCKFVTVYWYLYQPARRNNTDGQNLQISWLRYFGRILAVITSGCAESTLYRADTSSFKVAVCFVLVSVLVLAVARNVPGCRHIIFVSKVLLQQPN